MCSTLSKWNNWGSQLYDTKGILWSGCLHEIDDGDIKLAFLLFGTEAWWIRRRSEKEVSLPTSKHTVSSHHVTLCVCCALWVTTFSQTLNLHRHVPHVLQPVLNARTVMTEQLTQQTTLSVVQWVLLVTNYYARDCGREHLYIVVQDYCQKHFNDYFTQFKCTFPIIVYPIADYAAYSESKYCLRIFSPQRWGRNFAHARCLPSFSGKPQTPILKNQIVFTYCFVRLKCSRWSSAPPTVKYGLLSVFWMHEMWNWRIFIVMWSTLWKWRVMEWWGNGLESSTKVAIMCMTSRGAAGRLQSQAATFYEKGIQKLVPGYDNALILVETM